MGVPEAQQKSANEPQDVLESQQKSVSEPQELGIARLGHEKLLGCCSSVEHQKDVTHVAKQHDCQLREGWHMVAPKASRRPTCNHDIAAVDDSWWQLSDPSPAMEPISRKSPT